MTLAPKQMKGMIFMEVLSYEQLKKYLIQNIKDFMNSGGSGQCPILPNFEISYNDFMEFAKKELNEDSISEKVNCISNLKRAADCAVDSFLYVYKLYDVFYQKKLGFHKKLGFIKSIGAVSSRSIEKLNRIRNKMEHSYEIPKVEEIELYYDLVESFIEVLEARMAYTLDYDLQFGVGEEKEYKYEGYFSIEYIFDSKPKIKARWTSTGKDMELVSTIENYVEYMYFFRCFLLLQKFSIGIISEKHLIESLEKDIEP